MVHAKAGCIMAAFLKILPLWLLVFPGMASRVLFPEDVMIKILILIYLWSCGVLENPRRRIEIEK